MPSTVYTSIIVSIIMTTSQGVIKQKLSMSLTFSLFMRRIVHNNI